MLQIAKDLKKQEDNLVLEDPMPDVPKLPGGNGPMYSSYELYLTRKFRKHYDDIFSSIRADEQRAARISGGSKVRVAILELELNADGGHGKGNAQAHEIPQRLHRQDGQHSSE